MNQIEYIYCFETTVFITLKVGRVLSTGIQIL